MPENINFQEPTQAPGLFPTAEDQAQSVVVTPPVLTGAVVYVYLQLPLRFVSGSVAVMVQNDTAPARAAYLTDANGAPVAIPSGSALAYSNFLTGTTPPEIAAQTAQALSALCGLVAYVWQAGDLAQAGTYDEAWTLTTPDGKQMTFLGNSTLKVLPRS